MPRRRTPTRESRDDVKEAIQLVRLLRDRAQALAEPFSKDNFFTETPSEALDRREMQRSCVDVLARLLDLGFLQDVVDLAPLIAWYRNEGKTPIPFEHLKEISGPKRKGGRGVRYVADPSNVFAEIFGVGNDSRGVIGRQWPEAFPPSSVEGAAHDALFRSGVRAARALMQTERRRRAMRVREGIEMLASVVDATCSNVSSAAQSSARTPEQNDEPRGERECRHSPGYTSVTWFGVKYLFTRSQQAKVIQILWEARENGTPTVSLSAIAEGVGASNDHFRLEDVFRVEKGKRTYHPAFAAMITRVAKGLYALKEPVREASAPSSRIARPAKPQQKPRKKPQ